MQRQRVQRFKRYLRLAISLASLISVVYIFWHCGTPAAIGMLAFVGIVSGVVGALLGGLIVAVAALIRKLKQSKRWAWLGITLGSFFGAVNGFALGCRIVSPYCYITLNQSEELGDDFGLIPFGFVMFFFVPIGLLIGVLVGGIWGSKRTS